MQKLGVVKLPTMHIYAGSEGLLQSFPCGPSKIPILKSKIAQTINDVIDPETLRLKPVDCSKPENFEAAPCKTRTLAVFDEAAPVSEIDDVISDERKEENLRYLRYEVPFFKDFDDAQFYELMDKVRDCLSLVCFDRLNVYILSHVTNTYRPSLPNQAKLVTFEQGDVIMRQGVEGNMFYVIESGEVEIMVKTAYEDPLTTPSGYLGTVINQLGPHNYFGERALITNEPRAASIRATKKTRCFAFNKEDIPSSSVLSGKKEATLERIMQINSKYGTDVYDIDMINDQFQAANAANQERGSINTPQTIKGVDTDEEFDYDAVSEQVFSPSPIQANDQVISLLVRFKQIRQATRCFDYICKSRPNFGDAGEARRRALLVSKLSRRQREEFTDLFKIIDETNDGLISILELRRAMESIGEVRSDAELRAMINNANPDIDGNDEINFAEFMGVMAEAEFFYLFMDTFEMLDVRKTGYVSAEILDKALCGVRDLISDDRMSIIDTEDMDMQVDYETFANMLLGKPL
jgi:CRP-like cAMP-binding protein